MHFLISILFVCLFLTSCVFESGWPGSACIQGMDSAKYFVAQTDTFVASSYPKAFAEEVLQTRKNAQDLAPN